MAGRETHSPLPTGTFQMPDAISLTGAAFTLPASHLSAFATCHKRGKPNTWAKGTTYRFTTSSCTLIIRAIRGHVLESVDLIVALVTLHPWTFLLHNGRGLVWPALEVAGLRRRWENRLAELGLRRRVPNRRWARVGNRRQSHPKTLQLALSLS